MQKKINVAGAVILAQDEDQQLRMLLAQRSYPEKLAGLWELPGGKQENGESLEQTVLRELAEELALDLRDTLTPQVYLNPDTDTGFWELSEKYQMMVYLLCLPKCIALKPGKSHQKLRWEKISQIDNYQWLEGDWPIIKALKCDQNLSDIYRISAR